MDSFDDEDEIVEEIPVFLSRNLQDNLYLFQYPTKTQTSNFDTAAAVSCCAKPISQEVKVDFALDTESLFYDRFKGEQIALAADGKSISKGERPTYKRGIMDKQTFVSSTSMADVSNLVVGIYADKEFHLTPLTSILQLRPSFSHFDQEDKRNKAEQKALNEEDEDEELQQVTVKFARSSSKKTKERQGFDTFLKNSSDEPWCETYWHSRTSPTAELERQKLFATNRQINHAFGLESSKYVEKLLSPEGQDHGIDALLPARVISKAKLRSMPLIDQLKCILKDAKMLSFDEVMSILHASASPNITVEKVLRTIPQVGILIHGNWVAQSEILYPSEMLSNANGVKAEFLIRGRDYVLYRFSRTKYLYRPQVILATQLPPEEATDVLQSVAKLNSDKKWELILTPDKQFEHRYPDLVQRQEMVWRATEQTYNEMDHEKSPKRARKRSQRDSKNYSSNTDTLIGNA